jgi:outer membrane protein
MPVWALELTLDRALALGLAGNLELQQAHLELERAEHQLVYARGAYDPQFTLGIDRQGDTSQSNDVAENDVVQSTGSGWVVGLQQDLPGGGAAALTWRESTSDSDSATNKSNVSTSTWAGISVSQPLLAGAGPLSWSSLTRARIGLDREILDWRRSQEDLIVDIAGAYWNLVASEQGLALARRSVGIAATQLEDTQERLEEGFAGSGDVLQVRRALGVARQAEVVAEAGLASAQARLARLLGLDLARADELDPVDLPQVPQADPDAQTSYARAQARNVSWLRAELTAVEAQLDRRLAVNGALPSLDLVGAFGYSGGDAAPDNARGEVLGQAYPSWSVGLDLSVPLPARSPRATASRARLAEESALLGLQAAEQDLLLRVDSAVRSVRRDRARVKLAVETVDAAQAALAADQELVQEGKGSTRDVIRSLENLDSAQLERLRAQIDLQKSLLDLKRIEGSLVD